MLGGQSQVLTNPKVPTKDAYFRAFNYVPYISLIFTR
jgi:hypothetical protein